MVGKLGDGRLCGGGTVEQLLVYTIEDQQAQRGHLKVGLGYQPSRTTPSDPVVQASPCLSKSPQLPETPLAARDQVFKHMSLWRVFYMEL